MFSPVFLRLAKSKLLRYLSYPYFLYFKSRNINLYEISSIPSYCHDSVELTNKEDLIRIILSKNRNMTFLEIGIGYSPNIERLELMRSLDITYTGVDFDFVCTRHINMLKYLGIEIQNIYYYANKVGTYAWTLFEMMQKKTQFDLIYLDGHHTFYVDFPTVVLANHLLRPGGLLLLDDILWTLELLHKNMINNFHTWSFYRKMYDLSQFTKEQKSKPHIKLIAEDFLISKLNYRKVEELSISSWWVLQKPNLRLDQPTQRLETDTL